MISLRSKGVAQGIDSPIVGVVRWLESPNRLGVFRSRESALDGYSSPWAIVRSELNAQAVESDLPHISGVSEIQALDDGDIVALQPSGRVDTLFRGSSGSNSLFVTEQCNSLCLMCSQPPRAVDDIDSYFAQNVRMVRLLPKNLEVLGITGGEPTLLGKKLPAMLELLRECLPLTQIEILSNARLLANDEFASAIAEVSSERLLFSIPLYSDSAPRHDYVVQSSGAFAETVDGLFNLASKGVRVEVRVVLHRQTAPRLAGIAKFVQMNLPFVEHVAFMGLEVTGLARANLDALWCEPEEYMEQLQEAVHHLSDLGRRTSVYNLPRCLVAPSIWGFLRDSISDWKKEYTPACDGCSQRPQCGGVFGTSSRLSALINPV